MSGRQDIRGQMGRLKEETIRKEDQGRKAAQLGDIAAAGLQIFCWCNRCGHNSEVDSAMLVSKLGPAMPVPEVGARMRCSNCQSKDIATRPAWPTLGEVANH